MLKTKTKADIILSYCTRRFFLLITTKKIMSIFMYNIASSHNVKLTIFYLSKKV